MIYMRRKSIFDDGDRMFEDTRGDNVFDLIVKPIHENDGDNWNEKERRKQKYKNLSRSSLDDILEFKI